MKGMRRLWELAADLAARRHQEATASYWYKQLAQQQLQQQTYQQQLGQLGQWQPSTWNPPVTSTITGITTTTGGGTISPSSYQQYYPPTPPTPFTSTSPTIPWKSPQEGNGGHDSSDFTKCQHPDCVLVRNWEPLLAGGDDSKEEDHGQDEGQ